MKRFTETTKWQDPWFRRLPAKLKAFWLFLVDNCDVAGVWNADMELAVFQIGEEVTVEEVTQYFADRVQFLPNGRWFLTKFIAFQYGELNPQNRCHLAVLRSLKENGVPPVLSPSAPKALPAEAESIPPGEVAGVNAVEELWRAHEWQGMSQEEAIALLKDHFPTVDVWGEYLRFKKVRSKAGQMPTWRPFLAWLRKASPTMNLGKKMLPKSVNPSGWRDFLVREYPKADPEASYATAPVEVIAEFLRSPLTNSRPEGSR